MATARQPVELLAVARAYRRKYGTPPPSFRPAPKHIPSDIIPWAEERFYIPRTKQPIVLAAHQKPWLRLALTRNSRGKLPYQTLVYSTIKQSGKSTIAGVIARWYAETQGQMSEIYCIGNDAEQAKMRSFREVSWSVELSPGFDRQRFRLPGEWILQKTQMLCQLTGTQIRALAVDPEGEAGGKPAVQVWTELWGFVHEDAVRFWNELTPIPTIPDSIRIVETYAGYVNESMLLYDLWQLGQQGHQLSAGELAFRTGEPLGVFQEAQHPDDPVPIWENPAASLLMYWDEGQVARRMPWQLGQDGEEYYASQAVTLKPNAYRRLHENEWTSSESAFCEPALWDRLFDPALPLLTPGDNTPLVLGVDAATSDDCFAIVAVSRHPERNDEIAVRAARVFNPRESGGRVDYDEVEAFIRETCALYNVVQIAYDAYQIEQMMQRLQRDEVAWTAAFSQMGERLKGDKGLHDMIIQKRIWHDGNKTVREHVLNAGMQLGRDGHTFRIVKRAQVNKIDACVALSMASARCLELVL